MTSIDRVIHRLKLRDMRLLDAVVRAKSMARAAAQLNLTQPAVSKAMSELEHTLGVRLLDRSRQGIEPTPHGRALLRRGAAIFDELRQGVSELEFLSDPTAGEVRVATSEPIAAGPLPFVIGQLSRSYPRLSVYVTQSPIASLQLSVPQYADLRERKVDLVFGPVVRRAADDDLATEILFKDDLVVAAHMRHPCQRRRRITLAGLVDQPWTLPALDSLVGLRCVEAFRESGLDVPRPTLATMSMQLQMGLVTAENYLTMFPASLVRFGGARFSIKALPVILPVEPRIIGIITLKNRTISPAAHLFIQAVREAVKPMGNLKKRASCFVST